MADKKEEGPKSSTDRERVQYRESERGKRDPDNFPVIGIGASAGGLEALSRLFENMPGDTGAAFIVVQHLAPSKESALADLLGRHSLMPAYQINDNQQIKPNTIYIIPPERNITIAYGSLHLLEESESASIRHPIDFFFKSLAADRHAGSVGIIMSGTGSDGTDGARAIKAELGLVIVQDPEEAKYDGMPRSVIDSGLADFVLNSTQIPNRIISYINHIPDAVNTGGHVPDDLLKLLPKMVSQIRISTGHDFSAYKESTLIRRIRRRMAIHQITEPAHYLHFLQENPGEDTTLFKEMLISVTSFFRDREAFEALKAAVKIRLKDKQKGEEIRAWVVGCASGEEAYSIAIIIREILNELRKDNKVQIFATDLDSGAIEAARAGIYRSNIIEDVTPQRLKRFFDKKDDAYQVKTDIREMVIFAAHSLVREPPFLRMDLISARNLLIYLKGNLQKRLIPLFRYALDRNGILFLSPSETIGEFTDLFDNIDRTWKIYQAKPTEAVAGRLFPPYPLLGEQRAKRGKTTEAKSETHISEITDKILLSDYAPPYVVVDGMDNVVYVRGDTGRYLKLAQGEATMNILELTRGSLSSHISMATRHARRYKKEMRRENIKTGSSDVPEVDIIVRPAAISNLSSENLMVIFKESAPRKIPSAERKAGNTKKREKAVEKDQYIQELEQELKHSREDLQATIEELETSNEELKSANEELLSSNEELQSTNEELETSREELRSVNEELSGLNAENQERIENLNQAQDNLRNLINSMNVATVFLNTELKILNFTPIATRLFSIRENDIGRPLNDIRSKFHHGDLMEDLRKVLDSLHDIEKEVQADDGHWYLMHIMPYRTQKNEMTGLLITFFDIDEKRVLKAALQYTQSIIDTVREPMLILNNEMRIVKANRSFYRVFRTNEEDTRERHIYELGNGQWDIPDLRNLLERIILQNTFFNDYPVEHNFPVIGRRRMILNARRLYEKIGSVRILLAIEDITEKPRMERSFSENSMEEKNDG